MRKDEEVLTKKLLFNGIFIFFRMRWSDDFSLPENGGHLEKSYGFQIRLGNSGFSMNGQRIVPRPHGTGGVWRYSGQVWF